MDEYQKNLAKAEYEQLYTVSCELLGEPKGR